MQHQPCHGTMHQTSNYIRSGFLLNLLWVKTLGEKFKFTTPGASWLHTRSTRSGSLLPKTQPVCQSLLHVSTASWTLCRTYSFMHEVRSCSFLWAVRVGLPGELDGLLSLLLAHLPQLVCKLFKLVIPGLKHCSAPLHDLVRERVRLTWMHELQTMHIQLNQGLAHTNSVTHIGHHCPLIYSTTASHINTFTE